MRDTRGLSLGQWVMKTPLSWKLPGACAPVGSLTFLDQIFSCRVVSVSRRGVKPWFCLVSGFLIAAVWPTPSPGAAEVPGQVGQETAVGAREAPPAERGPWATTVISGEEIRQAGARTLLQALELAVSVHTQGSGAYVEAPLLLRGGYLSAGGQDTLVLIDGRPLRDSFWGGASTLVLTAFPVETVGRIELTRGPVPARWAAYAVSGMVNVITRGAPGASVQAGAGGSSQMDAGATAGWRSGKVSLQAGGQFYRDEGRGWHQDLLHTQSGSALGGGQDAAGVNAAISWGNLDVRAVYAYSNMDFDGLFAALPPLPQKVFSQRLLVDCGYSWQPAPAWDLDAHFTLNYFHMHGEVEMTGPTEAIYRFPPYCTDLQGEMHGRFRPRDGLDVEFGAVLQGLSGSCFVDNERVDLPIWLRTVPAVENYRRMEWNTYGQIMWSPSPGVRLTAGLNESRTGDGRMVATGSAGVAVTFAPGWEAAAAFGRSCRPPSVFELDVKLAGYLSGDPELRPPRCDAGNVRIGYSRGPAALSLSFFAGREQDAIVQYGGPNGSYPYRYVNWEPLKTRGLEWEGRFKPASWLALDGSFSILDIDGPTPPDCPAPIPSLIGKAGVVLTPREGVWLSVREVVLARPEGPVAASQGGVKNGLNAHVGVDLNQLLHWRRISRLELRIFGENLFGVRPWSPLPARGTGDLSGRWAGGSLKMVF